MVRLQLSFVRVPAFIIAFLTSKELFIYVAFCAKNRLLLCAIRQLNAELLIGRKSQHQIAVDGRGHQRIAADPVEDAEWRSRRRIVIVHNSCCKF